MSTINLKRSTPSYLNELQIWESSFSALSRVQRITEDNIYLLRQMLAICENQDSYLTSASYYLFTGRNGLWIYGDSSGFLIVCWHPNISGKILIYPQFAGPNYQLIMEFLAHLPASPAGIQFARLNTNCSETKSLVALLKEQNLIYLYKEDVLDWTYPVHVLSTKDVAALHGNKFMYIRNRVNQLRDKHIEIRPYNIREHSGSIERLLHAWVSRNAQDKTEYENMYSPYENLFWGGIHSDIDGISVLIDGTLQAVGLWSISNKKQKTGNLFVNLSNTDLKGLSEFLIVKCCDTLHNQGINYLNIGGSETQGLNEFKRKFRPYLSIDMLSAEVATQNKWPVFNDQAQRKIVAV